MTTTIRLDLTMEQVQVIDRALAELPFKFAAPVLQSIVQQVQAQQPANEVAE
jgi:hypothetical protein